MMITVRSGSASRRRACNSIPSMPGILISISPISYSACWMASSASRPLPTGLAVYPSLVNHLPSESRTTSSSSTIRILPFTWIALGDSTAVAITFSRLSSPAGDRLSRLHSDCGHRQAYLELRSQARLRSHRDLAAVLLHDAMRHREAQPGAVLVFLGGEERIENARHYLGWDPASVVLHPYHALLRLAIEFGAHFQPPALAHGFRRVHQQHQNHLLDLVRVAQHRRQMLRQLLFQGDVLHFQLVLDQQHRAVDDGVQIVGLAHAGRLAGKSQ